MGGYRKVVRWIEQDHTGAWCVREITYGRRFSGEHIGDGHVYTPLRSSHLDSAVTFLSQFDKTPLRGG